MPWISWISSPLKNDANHLRPQEFRAQRNLASYSRSDFRTWLTDKKCREQPGNLRNSRMLHENREKHPSKILESTTIFKAILEKKSMSLFRLYVINSPQVPPALPDWNSNLANSAVWCQVSSVQSLTPKSLKGLFLSPIFYVVFFVVIGDLLARHHHRLRPKGEKRWWCKFSPGFSNEPQQNWFRRRAWFVLWWWTREAHRKVTWVKKRRHSWRWNWHSEEWFESILLIIHVHSWSLVFSYFVSFHFVDCFASLRIWCDWQVQ